MTTSDHLLLLDSEEIIWVQPKLTPQNKLIFAVMLKFFQTEGRYPEQGDIISELLIKSLSDQLSIFPHQAIQFENMNWETRSIKRFRQEIRELLGYKSITVADSEQLVLWLIKNVLPESPTLAQSVEKSYQFFREHKLEPFAQKELERYVRSAQHAFEKQFFLKIREQLSEETIKAINALLQDDEVDSEDENTDPTIEIKLRCLKKDLAGVKLKHVRFEIKKLKHIHTISVPTEFFNTATRKLLQKYYLRILAALPSNIEEYIAENRYAMMAIFCHIRAQLLTDNMADFLLKLIHKVKTSAEHHVIKTIVSEVKKVDGKFDILYILANTNAEHPTGVIQEHVYPQVSQVKLRDLAKELRCKGKWYQSQVQLKMHSLYSHAHRKELLVFLDAFVFRANHQEGKTLVQAIEFVKQNKNITDKYYSDTQLVPIDNVIYAGWYPLVMEEQTSNDSAKKQYKVNRINYEIAVFELLHKQLTYKAIWIEGSYRYRNPDEDMPKDWDDDVRRKYYYKEIKAELNADDFIQPLKDCLEENLQKLNDTILSNDKVKILDKKGGRIKLTPYEAQKEPPNIKALKQLINRRWSSINLIDMLKESDFRTGFTKQFHTVASRESLNPIQLIKRLLLCIYGLGSNTGLKRISSANKDASYSDLRYTKRRYINVANVKAAIVDVVNEILEIRDTKVWGDITVGCGCDSTLIGAWDQNLTAAWHVRYHKPGVMIYLHADKNATCIYSQLKTCASSEVGSMIRGVLRHDTKMDMNKTYVDTHGQSSIGFAFTHLLNFELLPRLKNLNKQKLYYSSTKHKNDYPNLNTILKTSINWETVKESYDEVIKNAVALKFDTVDPDVLIKRYSKDNYNHPVYKALNEIGHAVKTIFLCKYLMSEELRIEIHEALNVIESLNSLMNFIFYGKLGEMSTNNREDQALIVACLHLVQVCMSHINTLIIQEVLPDSGLLDKLKPEDKRALTTLLHAHINPYGLFPLDLDQRLIIENNKDKKDNRKQEIWYVTNSAYSSAPKSPTVS